MSLHLPKSGPGGVFGGEAGTNPSVRAFITLDDGRPAAGLPSTVSVDHDARTLSAFRSEMTVADELTPPAIRLPHTQARRAINPPVVVTEDEGGETLVTTHWTYAAGQEVQVQERSAGVNIQRHFDLVQHYDGTATEHEYATNTQPATAYDFQWQLKLTDEGSGVSYPRGRYLWDERLLVPEPPQEGEDAQAGVRYRQQELWYPSQGGSNSNVETIIQAHVRNVWLSGYLEVGQTLRLTDRYFEVTHVYEREDTQSRAGYRSRVDVWRVIARLVQQYPAVVSGERELVEDRDASVDERYEYPLLPGGTLRRTTEARGHTLRDVLVDAPPPPPPLPDMRWTGAGGRVTVKGPRTSSPQWLEASDGRPNATLTAFGHEFTGGSWAAIRDAPTRNEQGEVTDWDRVLVLHASADTVTAVRMDGSTESIPREQFEREVLRVGAGEFLGFSPVGTLFHSWPHDWAWCVCKTDTRAVTLHEAWRDSQVVRPKLDASPPPGPDHWYWKARPRKRPRKLPAAAPHAPLRLTLADIAAPVLHDEPLKRGEGPLLLPETATAGERDVRRVVAKRVYYPPAEWDEELDDRTSTTGPLRLTFKLPDPPRTPQGDDPGEDWAAALVLRLKTAKLDITVNGETIPLGKLGHNAGEKRGWHPYVVPVPVTDTYTLTFQGQCSRALLCVRKWPKPSEGGAS